MKPTISPVPRHLGVIIDGNRRFSKRLMIKPWKGHEWGARKVEKLLDWAAEYGIKELTLYAFSVENFNRPKKEFNFIMNLFEKEFTNLLKDDRIHKEKIKINFIGRIWMFPEKVRDVMQKLMYETKDYNDFIINFAVAYGGRAEIIDATKRIAEKIREGNLDVDKINEEVFEESLYLKSEPDLIIRTSESRLSGFLIWQSSYAEIIFLKDLLWPEFEKKHFVECLKEYANRKRRFGK